MATITTLGFSIRSSYDPSGTRAATRSLITVGAVAEATTTKFNSTSGSMQNLAAAALSLAPALIPIGTVALGVGAATAAMAVTTGSALGIYGAAMQGAVKNAIALDKAHKALDPTQKTFIQNLDKMKGAWNSFIKQTSPTTLRAATTVVQGIISGIQKLKPVVDAVAPSIQGVANSFKNWMQGEGFQRFINDVITRGVPALNSLIQAGKNVLATLGIGFRTFAGMGVEVAAALERGSRALRSWAEGGGFSRFLHEVNENAPQVKEFFRVLFAALGNVSKAMAGLGPLSLGLATGLLRIVAALPPSVIQAMVMGFVAFRAVMVTMLIVKNVVTAFMALRTAFLAVRGAWMILSLAFAGTPIGLIITGVALLVAGIVYLATQTRFFQTVWSAIWNGIKIAFNAVVDFLRSKFGLLVLALGPIGWLLLLAANWKTVWNGIKAAADAVWNAIKLAWSTFINAMATTWNVVSQALKTAWNAVWNAIKVAGEAVWNAIKAAWAAVGAALTLTWNTVSNALKTAWSAVWNAMKATGQAIWNAMKAAWQAFLTGARAVYDAFANALKAAWSAFWNAIKTAAQAIWNAAKAAWQAFVNAVRTIFNTWSAALKAAWSAFWNAVKTAAQAIWNAAKAAWQAFVNAVRTIFNTFAAAFKTAWNAAWTAVKNTANTIWNAIKDLWSKFTTAVRQKADSFISGIKKAFSDCWNSIKSTANKVWHEIGEIIEKAINGVISIVNGLIGGFNKITSFLKIDVKVGEIPKVNFNFAEGGMVPGGPQVFAKGGMPKNLKRGGAVPGYSPGRDTVPAVLSPGEGVLTPEAVRGLGGPGFVHAANRTYSGHRGGGRGARTLTQGGGARHFANGGMALPLDQRGMQGIPMADGLMHYLSGTITSQDAAGLARAGISQSLVTQGSFSNGSLSAGTHMGDGVVDIAADPSNQAGIVAALRAAGWAAWFRTPEEGFAYHVHAVLMNASGLSPEAAAQVQSYLAGGNGLANGGADTGIDIFGIIKDNVGKILANVYKGASALAGIGGGIADFFGMGSDKKDDGGGLFGTGIGPDIGPDIPGADKVGDVARGVVGAATGASGLAGMLGQMVLSFLDAGNIAEGFSDPADKFKKADKSGGGMAQIAIGLGEKLLKSVIPDFLLEKKKTSTFNPADFAGAFGSGGTSQWAALAATALQLAGLSASQLPKFLALMAAESGGNPMAINLTDSNAKAGIPSKGLMQVIDPTFAAYHVPGTSSNIYDPLANMAAAANYIKHVYGGNVPGSPYASGTNHASRGWHLVGENGPEMRYFRGGERVANTRATQRELRRSGDGHGGIIFKDGCIRIDARGATVEAVREMETNLVPKLKQAIMAGVGKR